MSTGPRSLKQTEAIERAALLSVTSYAVSLDLDRGDETFSSVTTIELASEGGPTFLDVQPVDLRSVTLNGRPVDVALHDRGRLPLDTDPGTNRVVVDAEMRFRNDGEGLHRAVDPADGQHYVYAMPFLDAAPSIFGCFDQPDLKAPFTVEVRAPRGWTVLGNSPRHRGRARPLGARHHPTARDLPRDGGRRALPRRPKRARRDPAGSQRAALHRATPRR